MSRADVLPGAVDDFGRPNGSFDMPMREASSGVHQPCRFKGVGNYGSHIEIRRRDRCMLKGRVFFSDRAVDHLEISCHPGRSVFFQRGFGRMVRDSQNFAM